MKPDLANYPLMMTSHFPLSPRRSSLLAVAALLLAAAGTAPAQILIGPLGEAAGPSTPGFPTSVGGGFPTSGMGTGDVGGEARRFKYSFRLNVTALYDSNIFISKTNRVHDYEFTITPGVTLGWGDVFGRTRNYLRLDYAPSFQLFANNSSQNNIGQNLLIDGKYSTGKATWRFAELFTISNGANTDIGNRVPSQLSATTLGVNYVLSDKTNIDLAANFAYQGYQNQLDTMTVSGAGYFNYVYSPKLTIGLGVVGGLQTVNGPDSPDQTFEQANLQVIYQATGKISVNAIVGAEFRQFSGARSGYVTPVFTLSGVYVPFDGTTITLAAFRRIQPSSSLVGQSFTSTGFTLSFRQRFYQRLYLTGSGTFENSYYFANVPQAIAARNSNYISGSIGLDYFVREGWTVGAFYLNRQSFGNQAAAPFDFIDHQVGIRSTVSF